MELPFVEDTVSEEDKKRRALHSKSAGEALADAGGSLLRGIGVGEETSQKYGSLALLGGIGTLLTGAIAGEGILGTGSLIGLLGLGGFAAYRFFGDDGYNSLRPIAGKIPNGGTVPVVEIAMQKIKLNEVDGVAPKTKTVKPNPLTGKDGLAMPTNPASEIYKEWHSMDTESRMLVQVLMKEGSLQHKTALIAVFMEQMHLFDRKAQQYNEGHRENLKTEKMKKYGFTPNEAQDFTLNAPKVPQLFTRKDGTTFTDITPSLQANLDRKIKETGYVYCKKRPGNKHNTLFEKTTRLEEYILKNMQQIAIDRGIRLENNKITVSSLKGEWQSFNPTNKKLGASDIEAQLSIAYKNDDLLKLKERTQAHRDSLMPEVKFANQGWRGVAAQAAITDVDDDHKAIMGDIINYANLNVELEELQSFERYHIVDMDKRLRECHEKDFPEYDRKMKVELFQVADLEGHKMAVMGFTRVGDPLKTHKWDLNIKDARKFDGTDGSARTIVLQADYTDPANPVITHVAERKPGKTLIEADFSKLNCPIQVTAAQLESGIAPLIHVVDEAESVLAAAMAITTSKIQPAKAEPAASASQLDPATFAATNAKLPIFCHTANLEGPDNLRSYAFKFQDKNGRRRDCNGVYDAVSGTLTITDLSAVGNGEQKLRKCSELFGKTVEINVGKMPLHTRKETNERAIKFQEKRDFLKLMEAPAVSAELNRIVEEADKKASPGENRTGMASPLQHVPESAMALLSSPYTGHASTIKPKSQQT